MYYDYCDEFIERDFMEDVNEDNWSEFSYNKYTDTMTDYGEPTEWDIFKSSED